MSAEPYKILYELSTRKFDLAKVAMPKERSAIKKITWRSQSSTTGSI